MGQTLAIHWTVTTYGTWLHGDPRGSWKDGRLIGADPLLEQIISQNLASDAEMLSPQEIELVAASSAILAGSGVIGRLRQPSDRFTRILYLRRSMRTLKS